MKFYLSLFVLLIGCAHGSEWTQDFFDGSGGSSSNPLPEEVIPPTISTALPVENADPFLGPYQETDDQALVYSLDQTFWLVFLDTLVNQDLYLPIDRSWPCFNQGGSVRIVGIIHDDIVLNHLNLNFELDFKNCLIPDAWIQANIIYTGEMIVQGYLENGPFENMLTFSGRNMHMQGAIRYTDSHVSHINDDCSFVFLDNYHQSYNIGGLSGDICGRHTSIAERDIYP